MPDNSAKQQGCAALSGTAWKRGRRVPRAARGASPAPGGAKAAANPPHLRFRVTTMHDVCIRARRKLLSGRAPRIRPHMSGATDWPRTRLLLSAIVAIAILLRLPGYTESVWIDELYTSNLFVGPPVVLMKTLYSDIHPPLYFVFMHYWNAVFSDGEAWLRLPAMLCGLGSILLIYRIGEIFAGRTIGLVGAFLLAVSPVHIWYSQEARPYSSNILLLLLSMLSFARLAEGRRRAGWTLLFFFSLGGVVFTHYYMATFLFAYPALAWIGRSAGLKRILWSSGLLLALVAIYIGSKAYFSEVPTAKGYLRAFDLRELWALLFNWFLTGNSFTPLGAATPLGHAALAVAQALGILVVLRGAWRLSRERRPHAPPGYQLPLLMLVLPAFLFLLPFLGMPRTYIERSALPALPFFVLVMACGLTGFRRGPATRATALATGLAAAAVLVAFFAHRDQWTVYKPNPGWREAAAYFAGQVEEGPTPQLVYTEYPSATALTYYDRRFQEVKKFERNDRKLQKLLSTTARIFGNDGFPGGWIQDYLRARFAEYERQLETDRRNTVLEIRQLSRAGSIAPGRKVFYLLVHSRPGPFEQRLLSDPSLHVIDERTMRLLKIYKLQREI